MLRVLTLALQANLSVYGDLSRLCVSLFTLARVNSAHGGFRFRLRLYSYVVIPYYSFVRPIFSEGSTLWRTFRYPLPERGSTVRSSPDSCQFCFVFSFSTTCEAVRRRDHTSQCSRRSAIYNVIKYMYCMCVRVHPSSHS